MDGERQGHVRLIRFVVVVAVVVVGDGGSDDAVVDGVGYDYGQNCIRGK